MKVMVRLAVVFVTLFVVSNFAFAQCTNDQRFCYQVTATDENGNTYTDTWWVQLCNEGEGELYSYNVDTYYHLYLFGGGPGWFNTSGNPILGGNPFWTSWIADDGSGHAGYIQPQGTGGLLLTGEGHDGSTRYTVRGMKIAYSNCP